MRIALNAWFIDQPTTGSGQYLTHLLAEYATHHSANAFLLCGHAEHVPPETLASAPRCFEWRLLHTPFDGWHPQLAKVWFEQCSVPRACRRWGAELLHTPYWASPLFPGTPAVVTIHDLIPALLPAYRGGPLGRAYNLLVRASSRRATYVLTDSQAARQDILKHLHIAPARVEAVHLAAEGRYGPVRDSAVLGGVRSKYDLPGTYLLYLGGFEVRKNVPSIVRAFALLGDVKTHLVIAGRLPRQDTSFFPDPRRTAAELGIVDRVHFTGWVDEEDKPALYSEALAFVFPSLYEGFGLPPLEAMSCGTPVIASDRSSLPEVVGGGGLCVDPENVQAIAGAMKELTTNATLRKELQAASLAQADRFSWQRCAQATVNAYQRVSTSEVDP